MATTGIIKNREYYVTLNTNKFDHLVSCNLTIGKETIDLTSFDSSGWKEVTGGDKNWSLSLEAHYAMDASENGNQAFDDLDGYTDAAILLTTGVTGDTTFAGNGVPTSWDLAVQQGDTVKISVSYEGNGALTKGTV